MSDPSKTQQIHECSVCRGSIRCTADCKPIHRVVCAVCAVKS